MNALEKLVNRCNEMDITEQDKWLGDVFMPPLARAELDYLQAELSALRAAYHELWLKHGNRREPTVDDVINAIGHKP